MSFKKLTFIFLASAFLVSCTAQNQPVSISSLTFIGEQVIPQALFDNSTVGGLSGIDYHDGIYYLISDDNGSESDDIQGIARAYTAKLKFDEKGFYSVQLTDKIRLMKIVNPTLSIGYSPGEVDPEAMRFDSRTGKLLWVNEGQINNGIAPQIRELDLEKQKAVDYPIPKMFWIDETGQSGPRHNVVFEGLSMTVNGAGFWVSMEGPLIQDGEEASLEDTVSPVRISFFNRRTAELEKQFAYELDSVTHREGAHEAFTVNGVVDILEYAQEQFLVLERSFVSGQPDGGNDVKLYKVDASKATDIKAIPALIGADYQPASKTLLLDFNTIRHQLTAIDGHHTVDNLEGITFGPILPNGKRSLVVVGDNNFSLYAKQLNQFLVFAVEP